MTALEFVRENMGQTPYHQWLLPEPVEADDERGYVKVRLKMRPEFRRVADRPEAHGGIVATLIDIAGHAAIAAKVRHTVPTIDLRVDYLRLAGGETLTAEATVVKLGRTIGVVDIRILDDQQRLVAIGRGAYATLNL